PPRLPSLPPPYPPRPMRGAVEQGGKRLILARHAEHRRPPRPRPIPGPPYRPVDELAHRPPVLRPGIAALLEIARDDGVGGRTRLARGIEDGVEQLDRRLHPGGGGHGLPCGIIRRLAGNCDVMNVALP